MRPREDRLAAWSRLAETLDTAILDEIAHEIGLGEAIETAGQLIEGKVRGRMVVDVSR